jgi:hypothetical protein
MLADAGRAAHVVGARVGVARALDADGDRMRARPGTVAHVERARVGVTAAPGVGGLEGTGGRAAVVRVARAVVAFLAGVADTVAAPAAIDRAAQETAAGVDAGEGRRRAARRAVELIPEPQNPDLGPLTEKLPVSGSIVPVSVNGVTMTQPEGASTVRLVPTCVTST